MKSKLAKALSALLIAMIAIILPVSLFSTEAVSVNKNVGPSASFIGTPTARKTSEITILTSTTQTPTPTLTATLSSSPTLTGTPAYPSPQDIRNALSGEFSEIKDVLQSIDQKIVPSTSFGNIRDNLISDILWEYFGDPIITRSLAFLGLLPIIGKIALKLKSKWSSPKGEASSETDAKLNSILNSIIIFYFVIFVLFLLYLSFWGGTALQVLSKNDLSVIVEKLDSIEGKLQVQPNVDNSKTPTPVAQVIQSNSPSDSKSTNFYANYSTIIIIMLFLSLCANLVLLILQYRKRSSPYEEPGVQPIIRKVYDLPAGYLPAAVPLALILLLLPYPVEAFLLPFIIQYLIFAFFDVVRLHFNHRQFY